MLVPRSYSLLLSVSAVGIVLQTLHGAQAQWWSRAPADFEECADVAEKAATKEAKAAALTECNAKFAGRRRPGGGYTYYDFMQNRSFDIAGPNPTPQEQRQIDEQYTAFLDKERRSRIAAAVTAGPPQPLQLPPLEALQPPQWQQRQQPQPADLKIEKVPLPVEAPNKRSNFRPATNCNEYPLSCNLQRLSENINDGLRKLLRSSAGKDK